MDPSTLAVVGTNSMIEPIQRVIDSAIPTQPPKEVPDYAQDLDGDVKKIINTSDIGRFARPLPHDVSLDNPLVGLTPQEYLAFK